MNVPCNLSWRLGIQPFGPMFVFGVPMGPKTARISISKVAAQSEVQTLCIVGIVVQQLGKGIEAVALNATATSEHNMHTIVDNVGTEVQAQLSQNPADLEC